MSLRIYIIIDPVKNAKRQKEYVLKPYNLWYFHLLIAIGVNTIFLVYDTGTVLGVKSFKMVSPSNGTTLHIGDWLISDLEAYKNKQPDYGDLVVYSSFDGQLYTNRIVGLPNESIDIIDNVVNVNGNTKKAIFIKDTLSTQRKI